MWAVLEPRSNSMRRKVFQDALPTALALADRVILGGVFRAQQLGDDNRLNPESVAESVRALGKSARVFPSAESIAECLALEAQAGDVLLVMSNGSFDGLCEKLLKKLTESTAFWKAFGFFWSNFHPKYAMVEGFRLKLDKHDTLRLSLSHLTTSVR